MAKIIKILFLCLMFVVLSCGLLRPKYLPKEYIKYLQTQKEIGIIACVSSQTLDQSLNYGEDAFISDTTGKWTKAGVNPKLVLYSMLLESVDYLYRECKDPNTYNILIIPNVTSAKIRGIDTSFSVEPGTKDKYYGKKYSADLGINIRVIDKNQNEILNISEHVYNEAWGYGRDPGGCVNCRAGAIADSIKKGSTNAVIKAIYDVLPSINDQISRHEAIMLLELPLFFRTRD